MTTTSSDAFTLRLAWYGVIDGILGSFPSLDLCASTATLLNDVFAADDRVFLLILCGLSSPVASSCDWTSGALDENENLSRLLDPKHPVVWSADTERVIGVGLAILKEPKKRA